MTRPRKWLLVVISVTAVVILLGGSLVVYRVVAQAAEHRAATQSPSAPIAGAHIGGNSPGALRSAVSMPGLTGIITSLGVRAAKVEYRSTEGDTGAPTMVSGTVFVPAGDAPDGGWPVVAFGHGTTGIQTPCAPSLSPTLLDQAPAIAGFTKLGYAVAFADYQGLGAAGDHPYLDAHTAGLNIIDSVRALRATFPDVSTRWAAFGGSQGGAAVWSADEQASTYAPELDMVGAVALVPAVDMTGMVDQSSAGTMSTDQRPLLQWVLVSLNRLHPELNLDDFRRGVAAQYWEALSACSGPDVHLRGEVASDIGPMDLAPSGPAAAAQLRGYLQEWALPQRRLSAPLSVLYGDKDAFIKPEWTTDAIARACALGGTIQWRLEPDKGHGDIDGGDQLSWLADRFAGKDISSDCS